MTTIPHFSSEPNLKPKYLPPKKWFISYQFQMILGHFFVSMGIKYWFFRPNLSFIKWFLPIVTYSLRGRPYILRQDRILSGQDRIVSVRTVYFTKTVYFQWPYTLLPTPKISLESSDRALSRYRKHFRVGSCSGITARYSKNPSDMTFGFESALN